MTFEQFISRCLVRIEKKIPKDKIYFQYNYYPDMPTVGNSYKCQVIGTQYKIYITPGEKVCQYYDKYNNFENLDSPNACIDRFMKEVEINESEKG